MPHPPEQPDDYCPNCSGRGHVWAGLMQDGMSADFGDCPVCGGTGRVHTSAIRRFTVYRPAVPDETHNALQKNAADEAQFEGVVFTDGTVALRWRTAIAATSVWASLGDALAIHGHPEYGTVIVWHDEASRGVESDSAFTPSPEGRSVEERPSTFDIERHIVEEFEAQGIGLGPTDSFGNWHISGGVTPLSSGVDVNLRRLAARIASLSVEPLVIVAALEASQVLLDKLNTDDVEVSLDIQGVREKVAVALSGLAESSILGLP